jgi:hypothetical protein
MLRSLYNLFSVFHQVSALERLKPKIIVVVVPFEIQLRLYEFRIVADDLVNIIREHGSRPAYLILNLSVEAGGHLEERIDSALVQI